MGDTFNVSISPNWMVRHLAHFQGYIGEEMHLKVLQSQSDIAQG